MLSDSSENQNQALRGLAAGSIAILGIPWDEKSSYLRGPAAAAGSIRQAHYSSSTNTSTESGSDLADESRIRFLGDLDLEPGEAAFGTIERSIEEVLRLGSRVLCLGGDHSVTLPIVRAHSRSFPGQHPAHRCPHRSLRRARRRSPVPCLCFQPHHGGGSGLPAGTTGYPNSQCSST